MDEWMSDGWWEIMEAPICRIHNDCFCMPFRGPNGLHTYYNQQVINKHQTIVGGRLMVTRHQIIDWPMTLSDVGVIKISTPFIANVRLQCIGSLDELL